MARSTVVAPDGGASDPSFTIAADIAYCPLGDGIAVFNSADSSYFTFNKTAALLWERIVDGAGRDDLLDALRPSAPGIPDTALRADVDKVLGQLLDAGLVKPRSGSTDPQDTQ